VVGAGDNMKMVQVAERAIVGQASVPRCLQAQLDATKVERRSSSDSKEDIKNRSVKARQRVEHKR
jgi:hypothetical protein